MSDHAWDQIDDMVGWLSLCAVAIAWLITRRKRP